MCVSFVFSSFKAALHWTMAWSINIIAPNVGVFFCLRVRSSSCALTSIFLSFSSSVIYSFLSSSYSILHQLSSLELEAWSFFYFFFTTSGCAGRVKIQPLCRIIIPDPRSISPVPPLSSIGTRWRTRIATIREKLGTLTNGSGISCDWTWRSVLRID